jgi:glycerol-3-phosphate acyltransferase PlsX
MGGDFAPRVAIEGISLALDAFPDVNITGIGHLQKIAHYLEAYGLTDHPRLSLIHAENVVEMHEPATMALRGKKDSSISVAAKLMKQGKIDALFTAGHTGAAVAAHTVLTRTLPGVDRPAITTLLPGQHGHFILADAGANVDCKPHNLAQFALMAETYSSFMFGIENPRIGLLSVGGEDGKGNDLTKEAFKILEKMQINFVGNVEGNTIFENIADVVVCDGFTGNVVLKTAEGLSKATNKWMKDAFSKNAFRMTGAMLAKNAFRDLKGICDAEEFGGAPLLGINGICLIGHGSSSSKSFLNGIKSVSEMLYFGANEKIAAKVKQLNMLINENE